MSVKVRVVWGPDGFSDLIFSAMVKPGDQFFAVEPSGERILCVVGSVTHCPVDTYSGEEPSVIVSIEQRRLKGQYKQWWFWRELIADTLKRK